MGTRNLVCVYYKGRFMIAQYGQWDGYPEGQGLKIWRFVWKNAGNLLRLKAGLEHVVIITDEERDQLIPGQSGNLDPVLRAQIAAGVDLVPDSLSRNTGAGILELAAWTTEERPVKVVSSLEFVNNQLMCEWVYVLDLDADVLEVYNSGHGGWEFSVSDIKGHGRSSEVGGGKTALIMSFKLAELPDSEKAFVAELVPD